MTSEPRLQGEPDDDDTAASASAVGVVRQIPVDRIRTRFAALRPGRLRPEHTGLADGPLRVVPTADGHYEILDGFKFFDRWRDTGRRTVAAIVERPLRARSGITIQFFGHAGSIV